ncbi:MAG TPA: excinuclease ABC subunit UvrC [Candidatus Saccharimonadales bacterium]|nr:excinuclease ABC subunit UvrC [Candidatus Saccharimonadales bacterium]
MPSATLLEKVNNLPKVPGVYIYHDSAGTVIYVGKAKSLRNRVKSYFIKDNLEMWSKTQALVENIADLEYVEVLSELEALILEAELIKKYLPKYNIVLKDDKSYLYIVIRNEKVELNKTLTAIPKIMTARKSDILESDIIFGPFPEATTTKFIVRSIRKIFAFRDCSISKFNRYSKLGKPCLYGYIGLCQAPCVGNVSVEKYRRDIKNIQHLLEGQSSSLLNTLRREMEDASKNQQYEKAAEYRDIVRKFDYIRQQTQKTSDYIENPYLVEDIISKSLDELVKNIPELKELPRRIECYDISNISGKEAVGSMVVATDGRIDKHEYRKFRIKLKAEPDDFGMLREVLTRRLTHEGWPMPDLLVIDGGKGQVSAIKEVLDKLGLEIPLIGLAKRFETIVYYNGSEFVEVNLEKDNEGLKLLQRLRDEAHRFAQKYHHQLRLKKLTI